MIAGYGTTTGCTPLRSYCAAPKKRPGTRRKGTSPWEETDARSSEENSLAVAAVTAAGTGARRAAATAAARGAVAGGALPWGAIAGGAVAGALANYGGRDP